MFLKISQLRLFRRHAAELREVQRLRYKVFIESMGLPALTKTERLDRDEFDEHCAHLIVRESGGYLKSGAWLCGEPSWDPDYECADMFMLPPLANLDRRYAKHYGVDALA